MTQLEKINTTVQDFTNQDQLNHWIFEMGKRLPSNLTTKIRTKEHFVRGCELDVWVMNHNNKIIADSESMLMRGLCNIMISVFEDPQRDTEVALNFRDFNTLSQYLPSVRQRGMQKLFNHIQHLTTQTSVL